ncbi:MAG: CPBP family intramembrane metalloprotease [Desulfobacterales bacterium]|nr:CPBP family intramembrane metalloprotease [Desulfobacterales bacterium]
MVTLPRHRFLPLAATVLLAAGLWFITFALEWASFWIKISLSAALLAVIAIVLDPQPRHEFGWSGRAVALGLASAALLYLIFWTGRAVSVAVFDFAGRQIGGIYHKGTGMPAGVIAALLFFVTGPSEEIYWRGYLQRSLMERYGRWPGWAAATGIYAGVHIWSFNFMLVGAAAVAGAFWGAMYARTGNLAPVIISHAVWSAVIFTVAPMP